MTLFISGQLLKNFFCRDLGLDLFRENVLSLEHVRERCLTGLLDLIKRERTGDAINRTLVRNLLSMLCDLQVVVCLFHSLTVIYNTLVEFILHFLEV